MIRVTANAREATYSSNDLITSGSVGIPVTFNLSEDFDGLSNIAVFRGSGVSIDVALAASGECVVPHEAVAQSGGYLQIGVYGRNAEGTIVINTVWAGSKMILPGAVPSGVDPSEPTPDWTAQVQQMATEALEKAQNVENMSVEAETLPPGSPLNVEKTIDPETGAVTLTFYLTPGQDGVSPIIAVEEITGGHRVTVTDAQGTRSFDVLDGTNGDDGRGIASAVMNADYTLTLTYTDGTSYTTPSLRGAPGADGYSPFAYVSKSGKVVTISITDKQGTTTATVSDGEDGAPGVSPTITVTDITGGHRVTITDAEGAHSFDVMDGDSADAPVQDVQVNGVSVLQDGVANVPVAGAGVMGAVQVSGYGLTMQSNGYISTKAATNLEIKAGTRSWEHIAPQTQHASAFYGLAKAAGDTTQSSSSNTVGNYTDAAKVAIQKMLGIYQPPWELLNDITLTEEGRVDLTADANGTPYDLLGVYIRVYYAANLTTASTGYARYLVEDSDGTTLNAETGRYSAQTIPYAKFVYILRNGPMAIAVYAKVSPTGGSMAWQNKDITGVKFDFKNIQRIYMNTADVEPAGTRIQIYGQRAY